MHPPNIAIGDLDETTILFESTIAWLVKKGAVASQCGGYIVDLGTEGCGHCDEAEKCGGGKSSMAAPYLAPEPPLMSGGLEGIMSSDVGYPINVYGTVIVRDRLDMKCNYIFQRNRNNCQLVESEGESLILTGPTRGIVIRTDSYFEINLKIKQDKESEDRQFSKTLIDVDSATINYKVKTQTTASWLSEVDLMFSYVKKALEGTIEIRILLESSAFYGRVTVCTTDVASHILLYDSVVHAANTMGDDRVLKLLRRVVAVSVDQILILNLYPRSDDLNPQLFKFAPLIKGADKVEITCGCHRMQVKVTWSILSVRRKSPSEMII